MTDASPPARLAPPQARGAGHSGHPGPAGHLTRRQKAAIIVRFLTNEGAEVPITDLPEALQEQLTRQMGAMRYVDRATLAEVVAEFARELEGMGLTFPHGMIGALGALDGRISPQTALRLRKEAGVRQTGDPWDQVRAAPPEELLPILERESVEVAAVILAKLEVPRAADILGRLPGPVARRITYAVSQTQGVTPAAVDRIGLALAAELSERPDTAFDQPPVERVGEILNHSAAATRDAVLSGLEETDQDFAALVRRAIFTFAHVPDRLNPRDVARAIRAVDQPVLVRALAGARASGLEAAAEFVLDNISKRMAETLREEEQEQGPVPAHEGEAAMTELVNAIRRLEAAGEITLIKPGTEEESTDPASGTGGDGAGGDGAGGDETAPDA